MLLTNKSFLKSVTKNQVAQYVLYFIAASILLAMLREFIDQWLVIPVISKFPDKQYTAISFSILFLISIGYVIKELIAERFPTIVPIFFCVAIWIFYGVFVRVGHYSFYEVLPNIYYLDLIVVAASCYLLDFRNFETKTTSLNTGAFKEDVFGQDDQDLFYRTDFGHSLVNRINITYPTEAFSIAVFGEWGSGKTHFLNVLHKEISVTRENIIIRFNPWKLHGSDKMVKDFFSEIGESLSPYVKNIRREINLYIQKIADIPESEISKFLNSTFIYRQNETTSGEYASISTLIKQSGKKLIILIDDIDRLSGVEILEMLGLIRNTANFGNVFFIVAADREYVIRTLMKTGLIANEDLYLDKIFQLVITLPTIVKSSFRSEFRKYIDFDNQVPEKQQMIERLISNGFVENFENIREVKRFCNSFAHLFELLSEEIDILDLAYLELIKLVCFPVYNALSKKKLIKQQDFTSEFYVLETEQWTVQRQILSQRIDEAILGRIEYYLKALLQSKDQKFGRRFSYLKSFPLFFSYQSFGLISLKEFADLLNSDIKSAVDKIDNWNKLAQSDLNNLLDNNINISQKNELYKLLKIYLSASSDFYGKAFIILQMLQSFHPKLYKEKQEAEDFIKLILEDDEIPLISRSFICKEFIKIKIYGKDLPYLRFQEFVDYNLKFLNEFLNNNTGYDSSISQLYLNNEIERGDLGRISIDPAASKALRNYLLSNQKNFTEYLRTFVRSYNQPNDGYFVFDPFAIEIFQGSTAFLDALLKFNDHINPELIILIKRHISQFDKINHDRKFKLTESEKMIIMLQLGKAGIKLE